MLRLKRHGKLQLTGALALAGMLLLAGCGSAGSTGTGATAASTSTSTSAASGPGFAKITYNAAGFLAPGETGPQPGFGPNHDLDNESAPPAGAYKVKDGSASVTFQFPNVKGTTPPNDVLNIPVGGSGSFTVPAGNYSNLYFLAGVAGGPQPAQVVLTYKDGTKDTENAAFDDWCTVEIGNTPVAGTAAAWQGVTRIGEADGSSNNVSANGYSGTNQGCGLYVSSVKVNNKKVLTSVEVDNTLSAVPSEFPDITKISTNALINIVAATAV